MSRHKTRQSPWQSTCPTSSRSASASLRDPSLVHLPALPAQSLAPWAFYSVPPRIHVPTPRPSSLSPASLVFPGTARNARSRLWGRPGQGRAGRAGRGEVCGREGDVLPSPQADCRLARLRTRPGVRVFRPAEGGGGGCRVSQLNPSALHRPAPPRTAARPHYDFTSL